MAGERHAIGLMSVSDPNWDTRGASLPYFSVLHSLLLPGEPLSSSVTVAYVGLAPDGREKKAREDDVLDRRPVLEGNADMAAHSNRSRDWALPGSNHSSEAVFSYEQPTRNSNHASHMRKGWGGYGLREGRFKG